MNNEEPPRLDYAEPLRMTAADKLAFIGNLSLGIILLVVGLLIGLAFFSLAPRLPEIWGVGDTSIAICTLALPLLGLGALVGAIFLLYRAFVAPLPSQHPTGGDENSDAH